MDIQEPEITVEEILRIDDPNFNSGNVCVVSGCATGIGRACAIATTANGLTVADLDTKPGSRSAR